MKAAFCQICFSNLAVASRMKIFLFLKENGERTVSDIVGQLDLSQPTISYHLKNMLAAGLLDKRRAGKAIYYAINDRCPNNDRQCALKQLGFTN